MIPRLEPNERSSVVGNRLAGQQIEAADVDDAVDTLDLAGDAGERRHGGVGPFQRRGRREAHDGKHVALVLGRHQARWTRRDQAPDGYQQRAESQHDDDGITLHDRHALHIAVA